MSEKAKPQYLVSLSLEPIKLPPVSDILVLAKRHPQGKIGVMESFKFIAPDEFEMIDIDEGDETVEAVLINKKILKRLPQNEILATLKKYVFPHVSKGEAVKVDFSVKLIWEGIVGDK
ncbi:MAG: hypothetical protein JXR96_05915 [Deltaproteobacteria bacterium]|nr:hypothetical protein [Deltaproteobacteria bacterium]